MKRSLLVIALCVSISALIFAGCAAPAPAPAPAPATKPAPATAPAPAWSPAPAPAPTAAPQPAATAKVQPITLTHMTFQKKTEEHDQIDDWINRVQKQLDGRLIIKYLGADEVIPQKEQAEALRKGLIAMISLPATYTVSLVPESQAHEASRNSAIDQRQNGYFDLINECYHKSNIHFFMIGESWASTEGNRVFTKKPITGLKDFKGMKFAINNDANARLVKKFGGGGVFLAAAERYTAMERGVVDAAISALAGTFFMNKFYEVLKFYVDPGISRAAQSLYFNLDKWNELPQDMKKIMIDTAIEVEKEWIPKWPVRKAQWPAELEKKGMKKITFSAEDAKSLVDSYYEITWNEVIIPASPQYGPKLKALSGN